jgi:transcriptional regulator with XRE-family HTH domain
MAIGPTLQEARLKKQMTTSQVAEMTRMKVQIVDDLEHDDFHRIAATIYGKGFIKLFAECVDLDPKPLIADYIRSVEGDKPSLIPEEDEGFPSAPVEPIEPSQLITQEETQEEAASEEEAQEEAPTDLFSYAQTKRRLVRAKHPTPTPPVAKTVEPLTKQATVAKGIMNSYLESICSFFKDKVELLTNWLAGLRWGDAPVKAIAIVLGLLILLLFVISGISSCNKRHAASAPDDSILELAVDPPEPYFD